MSTYELAVAEGAVDSQAMFSHTWRLADFLDDAAKSARRVDGLPIKTTFSSVVALGMGGSSVGGEVLRALAASRSSIPILLSDGYLLPSFVDETTLVFSNSFSGNTEETLVATHAALDRGATVIAVTSGGKLKDLAMRRDLVCYDVPDTITQPRAALGAMVAPLLIACEYIGLLPGATKLIDDAVTQLRHRREELASSDGGIAGTFARRLGRTFPLIYGAEGIGAVAARRWKTQVNENAKAPAFYAVQPELCHNEICGFGQSGDVTRQLISLVCLRTSFEHPEIGLRFELVIEQLREVVADIIEFRAEGDGELAELFDLVLVGDFVSLHLATKEGIDPGPVPVLTELKEALSRLQASAARK